ncbi:MAG: LiaF-related protein [bacterium]
MAEQSQVLQRRRDAVITRLSRAFEAEELDDEAFEARLDRAHRAAAEEDLVALTADLAVVEEPATVPAVVPATALATRPEKRKITAIFGNVERGGAWTPGATQAVTSVFGSVELDFTQAVLPPGVTEIDLKVVFGNVEVHVPPHLPVECEGTAILGNFEAVDRAAPAVDPATPRLRIRGYAVFGNVEVKTRVPGQRRGLHGLLDKLRK